uniref:ID309 n=1 Tax=Bradyrhizobium japonicum TaxID=375 RepID=Q9AND7_BRAJP|nr:ID309 [Bradyrhizobium japonicum]
MTFRLHLLNGSLRAVTTAGLAVSGNGIGVNIVAVVALTAKELVRLPRLGPVLPSDTVLRRPNRGRRRTSSRCPIAI